MKILIVYDSVFGNTKLIATAMFDALKEENDCHILHVDKATIKDIESIDLVFIGSPTRAFNPTAKIKQFIKNMQPSKKLKMTAVFDTRMDYKEIKSKFAGTLVNKGGYANHKIVRILQHKKIDSISPEEAFYVNDTEGPLRDNEIERGQKWALNVVGELKASGLSS